MAKIRLDRLTKRYGNTVAVDDMSLKVNDGEFVALLGPSGCGKTTVLRMIAGFVAPTSGRITIGEHDVTDLPADKRDTAMVFQGYALFPHMTVARNVAFGLELRKMAGSQVNVLVREALSLVRLEGFEDRLPRELSGGQQQRVALARALVINPPVLLLDEPLSNLDAKLRHEVRIEMLQIHRRLGLTTVFVTHDQEEALTMADRLVVITRGRVQQIGTPSEVYDHPANHFVADFIGKFNFFYGHPEGSGVFRTNSGVAIAYGPNRAVADGVVGVRPEQIRLTPSVENESNSLPATLELVTFLGARREVIVRLDDGTSMVVHVQPDTQLPEVGQRCHVNWSAQSTVVLPKE